MSNLVLQCKESGDFNPHPEGIHPAVCVDVMDLGLVESEFQGQKKMVNKVRVVFESEQKTEDGKGFTIAKSFTASLHPKSNLAVFLGKWRGRPVMPGESIDLAKLLGASCTLVVSHQQNMSGKTYAAIDAVSKPTKKVTPSGTYDAAAARQRYADWKAKASATPGNLNGGQKQAVPAPNAAAPQAAAVAAPLATVPTKSPTPAPTSSGPKTDYDPEVGF